MMMMMMMKKYLFFSCCYLLLLAAAAAAAVVVLALTCTMNERPWSDHDRILEDDDLDDPVDFFAFIVVAVAVAVVVLGDVVVAALLRNLTRESRRWRRCGKFMCRVFAYKLLLLLLDIMDACGGIKS